MRSPEARGNKGTFSYKNILIGKCPRVSASSKRCLSAGAVPADSEAKLDRRSRSGRSRGAAARPLRQWQPYRHQRRQRRRPQPHQTFSTGSAGAIASRSGADGSAKAALLVAAITPAERRIFAKNARRSMVRSWCRSGAGIAAGRVAPVKRGRDLYVPSSSVSAKTGSRRGPGAGEARRGAPFVAIFRLVQIFHRRSWRSRCSAYVRHEFEPNYGRGAP